MSENESPLARVKPPYTFAVVGDLHYALASTQTELPLGTERRDPTTLERLVENVGYSLEPMAESLQEMEVDFLVQLGDLTAHTGDPAELRASVRHLRRTGLPVLAAKGDKDDPGLFDSTVMPVVSRMLGREVGARYFLEEIGGCQFIVLDTSRWDPGGDQAAWFRLTLNRLNDRGDRVFVFGHHPIWTVAKAFYSERAFCESVVEILSEVGVDAYFCGHTHNQSALWHRTGPTLQFGSAPIGYPDELPTPLESVQALLVDPDEVIDCWPGYLENTAPGWYTVHVESDSVDVAWHHLNRGAELEVSWKDKGQPHRFWQVRHPKDAVLISRDILQLRRLSLRFCAWDAIRPGKRVRINGVQVAELPPSAGFEPRRIDLPPTAVNALDVVNRVEIDAPGVEASTIGNIQLEGILPGGRIVRTRPTGQVFTWSDRWDPWKLPGLEKVMSGRPLRTLLSFQ